MAARSRPKQVLPAGAPPGWRPPAREERQRQIELVELTRLMQGVYGRDGRLHRHTRGARRSAAGGLRSYDVRVFG